MGFRNRGQIDAGSSKAAAPAVYFPWVFRLLLCCFIAFAAPELASATAPADLAIGNYHLVGSARVSRTVFDYTYQAQAANTGPHDYEPISAAVTSRSAATGIVDGTLSFGRVAAGASADSRDTFTIRQDRTVPFDPAALTWAISANRPPLANAGPDQPLDLGRTATLDGSGSTDFDGDRLHYAWRLVELPEGSQAQLTDPVHPGDGSTHTPHPEFTVDRPGNYRIRLIVNDGQVDSTADLVIVGTGNVRPVAAVGDPQTVAVGANATLDGTRSSDPEGGSLTYQWTLTQKPAGSSAVLQNGTTARPGFQADLFGDYLAELIVSDGQLDSKPATVVISTENSPPIAEAGPDRTVLLGDTVPLSGLGSRDPDADPLSYAWSVLYAPAGSSAGIVPDTEPQPTFTPDQLGNYIIQLIVRDPQAAESAATFDLEVLSQPPANQLPRITTTAPTAGTVGQAYVYDVDVADADAGDTLTYSLEPAPSGMTIDPATGLIQWTPDQAGDFPVTVGVTDGKGGSDRQSFSVTVDSAPPGNVSVPNLAGQTLSGAETTLQAAGLHGGALTYAQSETSEGQVIGQNPAADSPVAPGTEVNLVLSLGPEPVPPPDPAAMAPAVDPTVATTVFDSTQFLYSGSNPIQTGVAPGTIETKRAAVIRGKVLDRDNQPLPGVVITVKDHPEFGRTLSRADGLFDLAVNGGGYLTIDYQKGGFLPAQRQVNVPWQDYEFADEVVLIGLDPQVTSVDLADTVQPIQTAQGSLVTDADGPRRATVLFPQGTTATMTLPDGSTRPLTTLHVRATEYTVGENGPEAMPAALPATSGYTYAVELSVDEAVAAGARDVRFSQPVPFYVDNFLGFPVGMSVPAGWYDREKAAWIPSANGKVIKILSETGGLAEVDTDGDGNADAGLGITEAERERLAALYEPGQTLWRVPVQHFTPWDCNWPYGPPAGAEAPANDATSGSDDDTDDPDCANGSIVECENQVLGESIAVTGTPFSLNYRSNRMPGYRATSTLKVPLGGVALPPNVKRIDLEIEVAGQRHTASFTPAAGQSATFVWDGQDAYGGRLSGGQRASVRIGYVYDAVYYSPSDFGSAFAAVSEVPISNSRARNEVSLWRENKVWVARETDPLAAGGWTLNSHHRYDTDGTLWAGDGSQRKASAIGHTVVTTVAGTGASGYGGDGSLATAAALSSPVGIALGPDGALYIADRDNHRIRRVGPDGIITTVAGNGEAGFGGDGGPATAASLNYPTQVALGPEGALYIADFVNHRIRRVGPDGVITTVAGKGEAGFSGDGGPATAASLNYPIGVAVGADGTLYISDYFNQRIRRVGPDGLITTFAGNGIAWFRGDGGPAAAASLAYPQGITLGPDGALLIADLDNQRIRRVGPDGIITTVAGKGTSWFDGDGGPATAASLGYPEAVTYGSDGALYLASPDHFRIRRVGPDGLITTVAGNGGSGFDGDGGPATAASLHWPIGIAYGPDGSLYFADYGNHRIRRVFPALARLGEGDALVASESGSEVYHFDSSGRHLRTLNALTGAALYRFDYDGEGRLVAVTDGSGNRTTLERDPQGRLTALVAPFGQRTELAWDADGHLTGVANPAGETYHMAYTAEGLLTAFTDPKGQTSRMTYDSDGRLLQDLNAAGGSQTLSRQVLPGVRNYEVTRTTAEGRSTLYRMERLTVGDEQRTLTSPDGTRTLTLTRTNGRVATTTADGTVSTQVRGPDPRFGMQAPVPQSLTTATGGLSSLVTTARTAELADPNDPFSLASLSETLTVNGRTATRAYEANTRTWTATSAAGRETQTVVDALGRVIESRIPGLEPVYTAYDAHGRLASVSQGGGTNTRTLGFAYNPEGLLQTLTDPLGRSVSYAYDAVGRVTQKTRPDGRIIAYAYDRNGNRTALTPPGRPVHGFGYDPVDQLLDYTAPALAGESGLTRYHYNLDQQPIQTSRPDGLDLDFGYDPAGRLQTLTTPDGERTYAYDAATGQLTGVTTPSGDSLSFSHAGALPTATTWSGTVAGSIGYAYDSDFRIREIQVNGQNPVAYGYDPDSLLISAGALSLSRDSGNGLLTGTTLGQVADSLNYNGFGEVRNYTATIAGSAVYTVAYGRDPLGRITQKTETVQGTTTTQDYAYDLAGRLTEVKTNGVTTAAYGYDANGNRTTLDGTSVASYDDQDRLLSYSGTTYGYTANGELQAKTQGGQTTHYRYDVLGNLRQATLPSGTVIDYLIDGNDRRIGRKVNGTLTQGFLYRDGLRIIAELDGANQVISRFVYADKNNVPSYLVKGGRTYRIISDHLGSPRLVINTSDGSVVQRMDYDEWGKVIQDTHPGFQPFGYAGGLYDRDTGLVRFGARDYDAQTGRWTAKDPILFGSGGGNLYGYVGSNPVNTVDASGLCPICLLPALEYTGTALLGTIAGVGIYEALNNIYHAEAGDTAQRPPAGSRGIDQTDWSGDHGAIKDALGLRGDDNVKISPDGDVWTENPDGSWTNQGPARDYTESGEPSGRTGRDRERRRGRGRGDNC